MKSSRQSIIFSFLMAFVVMIGILHAVTPGHLMLYHDTYRRLSYFPITLGAIYFGLKGGVWFAFVSCLSFIPHLYLFWARGPQAYYSELSEMLFYLAAGLIIGMISSRENRLREEYRHLSEQLKHSYDRLHDQTVRLLEAEKQLGESQKLSMLGQVSASLAHEIKNPLASIKGAAEILADEIDSEHPKHEFVEIMRSEIQRLNLSVEDVLSYCRGQQAPDRGGQTEAGAVISRVVQLLESRMKEDGILLSIEPGLEKASFLTEDSGMTQVLINLLLNAADAAGPGGQVSVASLEEPDGWSVTVSDSGPGIDPGDREQIFKSFVTTKKSGTGLGLAICEKIVKRLGGRIEVGQSDLGGAAFSVFLPKRETLVSDGMSDA